MTRAISGLSEIADLFDAVLIDQFGVLHDGMTAFPGTRSCLDALAAQQVPMVAVTNSGKPASSNLDRLEALGFARHLFAGVITSGAMTRDLVSDWIAEGRLTARPRALILSRGGDGGVLDGLADVVPDPLVPGALDPEPDVVLIAGVDPENVDRAVYRELLGPLAARGVPAICANPDHTIYTASGPDFGPGLVANDYAAAGGSVVVVGKPGAPMFTAGLEALGSPAADRVLMIGDSPLHDIAGALAVGCKTLLIRTGVQAETDGGDMATPDFIAEQLEW